MVGKSDFNENPVVSPDLDLDFGLRLRVCQNKCICSWWNLLLIQQGRPLLTVVKVEYCKQINKVYPSAGAPTVINLDRGRSIWTPPPLVWAAQIKPIIAQELLCIPIVIDVKFAVKNLKMWYIFRFSYYNLLNHTYFWNYLVKINKTVEVVHIARLKFKEKFVAYV